jgi:hypothetical protein
MPHTGSPLRGGWWWLAAQRVGERRFLMESLNCGQCGHSIAWDPTAREPPWCPRCGADLKSRPKAPPAAPPAAAQTPALAPASAVTAVPAPAVPPPAVLATTPPVARPPRILGIPTLPPAGQRTLLVFALVAIAAYLGVQHVTLSATSLDDLNKKIDVWLEKPTASDDLGAYVRGKVLPIERSPRNGKGNGVAPDLYWALPRDLRARTPDEVGTVLWLDWEYDWITEYRHPFEYTLGGILVCKVTVIDKTTNTRLATRTFRGSDPTKAEVKGKSRDYIGEPPFEAIIAYLQKLPKRRL